MAAVPVCCGWYGADDSGVGEDVDVEAEVVEEAVVGVGVPVVVSNEELVVGGGDETVPTTQ